LPTCVIVGGLFGAAFGGVVGRLLMRAIFLLDKSKDGAKTDFGTAGQFTADGTATLLILTTLAGIFGGIVYMAIRRWLPWSSPVARGLFFGLLMMFGPGIVFLGKVDLQIFEPALPIFAMFIILIVLYGICVAVVVDRLRPLPPRLPGPLVDIAARWLVRLAAAAIIIIAALGTYNVYDGAGTCLTANGEGDCGRPSGDE